VRGNVLDSVSCIPDVDWPKSISNDVNEVLEMFGIEATTAVIYNELKTTVSYDGTYLDPRHLMMVADTMTYRGFVMPISRHGINRTNTGPLVRCSFEETADVLYDAAMFGEIDDACGVTQNIMTGQMSSAGTGAFDLMLSDWTMPLGDDKKKLIKTKVSRRKNDLSRVPDTIEYLNTNIWARNNRAEQVNEMPFVEEEECKECNDVVESDGNRHYASVETNKPEEMDVAEFVPSSPNTKIEIVKNS
jgi:DNA-directed RNA polymerase beta' subunit